MGLWFGQPSAQIQVLLMADDNSKPADVLETIPYTVNHMSTFVSFQSVEHPNLVAGTRYWLGLWTESSTLAWSLSNSGDGAGLSIPDQC